MSCSDLCWAARSCTELRKPNDVGTQPNRNLQDLEFGSITILMLLANAIVYAHVLLAAGCANLPYIASRRIQMRCE